MVIIMKKCIIASILALMLSLTTFAQATALPETKINDWAVPDVGRYEQLIKWKERSYVSLMSEGQRDSDF